MASQRLNRVNAKHRTVREAVPRRPAERQQSSPPPRATHDLLGRVRDLIDTYSEDGIENKLTEGLLYTTDLRRDLVVPYLALGSANVEKPSRPRLRHRRPPRTEIDGIDADRTISLVERRRRRDAVSLRIARQYGIANQVHQMLRAYLLLGT